LKSSKLNITTSVKKLIYPLLLAFTVHLCTYFPSLIEKYYSRGLYPRISCFLRAFCQISSISIGDCIYFVAGFYVLLKFIRFGIGFFKTHQKAAILGNGLVNFTHFVLTIYIAFMLLWGLNYSRKGIGYQLKVSPLPYSTEELCELSQDLIQELNTCRLQLDSFPLKDTSLNNIYAIAFNEYNNATIDYPFLFYKHPLIKSSLFTPWSSWIGYTGYYNPFSGEAQVRTDLPRMMIPFIACHEAAHQIGYADESEASFVAFVVSEKSSNVYLRYSALMDLYRYTRMELYLRNTYPDGSEKMNKEVKSDLLYIHNFFKKEAFKQSQTISNAYDLYLRMNGLEKGIESYNEVVAWAINWKKQQASILDKGDRIQ